ncbi:hypothetical protein Bca4012_084366 [Brassica carinata]
MMDSSPAPEIKQATRTEGRNASAKTTCRKRARDSSYSSTRKTRKEIENNTAMATNDSTRHWDVSKPRIESRRRARGRRPHEPLLSSQHAVVENRAAVPLNVQKLKPGDYGSTNQSKHEQSNKEAVDKLQALKLILEQGRDTATAQAKLGSRSGNPRAKHAQPIRLRATTPKPTEFNPVSSLLASGGLAGQTFGNRAVNKTKRSRDQKPKKRRAREEANAASVAGRVRARRPDAGAHQIYKRRSRES